VAAARQGRRALSPHALLKRQHAFEEGGVDAGRCGVVRLAGGLADGPSSTRAHAAVAAAAASQAWHNPPRAADAETHRYGDKAIDAFNSCALSEQKCVPKRIDEGELAPDE
jgi:hypothetical protein